MVQKAYIDIYPNLEAMRQLITALLIVLFAAAITKGLQDLREQRARERRFRQYEDSLRLKKEADYKVLNQKQ